MLPLRFINLSAVIVGLLRRGVGGGGDVSSEPRKMLERLYYDGVPEGLDGHSWCCAWLLVMWTGQVTK